MKTAFSGNLRFSEAVAVCVYRMGGALNWLRNVEIDETLPPLKGPRWVYAFLPNGEGFSLYCILTFDADGGFEVDAGMAPKSGSGRKTSGKLQNLPLLESLQGASNYWMFVTSGFPLAELSIRELSRYKLLKRTNDGLFFAAPRGVEGSDHWLPVVDFTSKALPKGQRRRYHWAGTLFEDGKGDIVLLALDFLSISQRLAARASAAQDELLCLTSPFEAKRKQAGSEKAVETKLLKLTLARLMSAVCKRNVDLYQKLSSVTALSDFIDDHERKYKKLARTSERLTSDHCEFLHGQQVGLALWWLQSTCDADLIVKVLYEKLTDLVKDLGKSPQGLLALANPPDHIIDFLHTLEVSTEPTRTGKDVASFSRKHIKSIVEFATKFVPGFLAESRLHREFIDVVFFMSSFVGRKYDVGALLGDPYSLENSLGEVTELRKHIAKNFASEVGGATVRSALKSIGTAADVIYWGFNLEHAIRKENRDIYDYAKVTTSINGALKKFVWEKFEKDPKPAALPGQKLFGPDQAKAMRFEKYMDEWLALGNAAASIEKETSARVAMRILSKRMMVLAPFIGAACDLIGGHGDYVKAKKSGDDVAAVAALASGVFSGVGGLMTLVPLGMVQSSALLAAFVPGVGWALLTAAAASAIVAWLATDSDWENFVEHTIFGKRNLLDPEAEPNWAFDNYGLWDGSAEGIRRQIMSAYAILCKIEISGWRDGIEVKLHHYEPEMKLLVSYYDSILDQRVAINVDLQTRNIIGESLERVRISVQGTPQHVRSVRITGDWTGVSLVAMQRVTYEAEAKLEWNIRWAGKDPIYLPPKPQKTKIVSAWLPSVMDPYVPTRT